MFKGVILEWLTSLYVVTIDLISIRKCNIYFHKGMVWGQILCLQKFWPFKAQHLLRRISLVLKLTTSQTAVYTRICIFVHPAFPTPSFWWPNPFWTAVQQCSLVTSPPLSCDCTVKEQQFTPLLYPPVRMILIMLHIWLGPLGLLFPAIGWMRPSRGWYQDRLRYMHQLHLT